MTKKEEKTIQLKEFKRHYLEVTIQGTADLILNKMNDVNRRKLEDQRKDKAKDLEKPNYWEEVITAIHWRDGKPTEFTEESMQKALVENAPCITDFGLMKSFKDAVVRFELDKYSTKFKSNVNMIDPNGLVPVTFTEHFIDEKIMSPKGSPVLVKINRFSGWEATFRMEYLDIVFSAEQILNIVKLAGFGIGIGSNRDAGYGRYSIKQVAGDFK